MHAQPDLRVVLKMDDRWFGIGDRCRYVPKQMTEPPELTNLRETLPREHALEAFRHLRGHEPDSSEQLETFIEDYIREAYSDGVDEWRDFNAPRVMINRRSMEAPIGKKLAQAGYLSLWNYFEACGFSDLEGLKRDLDFPTLTPVGFTSYVKEVATEDGNWHNAFRALVSYALNYASPLFPPSFTSLSAIHRISSEFPKDLAWVKPACNDIIHMAETTDGFLARLFSWDDAWLLELITKHQSSANGT